MIGLGRSPWWLKAVQERGLAPMLYDGAIPVEDILAKLFSWDALESPVLYEVENSEGELETLTDSTRKVIYRSDSHAVLGMFKEGYQGHAYSEWLLDTVALILDDELSIGSAGLLRNGAQAWVQVEVPENIVTPEGVEFRPNLLACTSFDGSLASTYKRCITNVVCDNTMSAGLSEAGEKYKVKHSKYSTAKLQDARDALAIVHSMADDFAQEVAELCAVKVTDKKFGEFIDVIAPLPTEGKAVAHAETKRAALSSLWNNDPRVTPWKNTAYGALQCVNTYEQHSAIIRGAGDDEVAKIHIRAMRNAEKMVKGAFDDLDRETYQTLAGVLR
jgi:phage/plasmid-like protein (TIGR03299 family)